MVISKTNEIKTLTETFFNLILAKHHSVLKDGGRRHKNEGQKNLGHVYSMNSKGNRGMSKFSSDKGLIK